MSLEVLVGNFARAISLQGILEIFVFLRADRSDRSPKFPKGEQRAVTSVPPLW